MSKALVSLVDRLFNLGDFLVVSLVLVGLCYCQYLVKDRQLQCITVHGKKQLLKAKLYHILTKASPSNDTLTFTRSK